ncbi:MAG: hypothetical protein H7Y11_03640 [Armatimonadetes bacterium]|nr:hypothetical protein [Anaerolineae bacterium]
MRTLHSVQMHERFVASGKYQTHAPTLTNSERWSIHQQPDDAWLVRSDEEQTDVGYCLTEAYISAPGAALQIERLDLLTVTYGATIHTSRSTVQFFEAYATVGQTMHSGEHTYTEHALTPGYSVTTQSALLWGMAIARLAQRGLTSSIAFAGGSTPLEVIAITLTPALPSPDHPGWRRFTYPGAITDNLVIVALDAYDIARQRAETRDTEVIQTQLTEYARRSERQEKV